MHDWNRIEGDACSYWKCIKCNYEWHQTKKPNPHFRFWYGHTPFNKIQMTCDEAVAKSIMES